MYRFTLHRKRGGLRAAYLAIFTSQFKTAKANQLAIAIQNNPCLSFLNGLTYDDILTAPYNKLVEIFYQYMAIAEPTRLVLNATLKRCFPYKSQSSSIMDFIERHAKMTQATTCPYCDCNEINVYHRSGVHRDYHLDHYLDKGRCPIVALSLHNFVPVCSACNTTKKSQTFGKIPSITKRLSPLNPHYDFDRNAYFYLNPKKEDILKIKSEEWCKKIKIDLHTEKRYGEEVKVTKILRRIYNNKKSLARQKLNEYISFVCEEFETTYGAINPRFALWARSYMKTSTEEERQKGLRQQFDKFKRDIMKL